MSWRAKSTQLPAVVAALRWPIVAVSPPGLTRRRLGAFLGGLLALLFLASTAAAFHHGLHEAIHAKSDTSHHCLLCALQKGQFTFAESSVPKIVSIASPFSLLLLQHRVACGRTDLRLAAGRAPPFQF